MKDLLKSLILQLDEHRKRDFIEREIEIPLHTKKIITIIGPRRSGKSTVMFQLMRQLLNKDKVRPQQIVYINFEDERLEMDVTKLDWIIQAYVELYPSMNLDEVYFFFDEIQNVPGWEKFIRRMYDSISRHIFLTGSNAKFLSVEIATALRGRCLTYEVLSLNFKEYLKFKKIRVHPEQDFYKLQKHALIKQQFVEYLTYGGFPEIIFFPDKLKIKTLQEYFNVMILRDVAERYKINNLALLKFFIKRMFETITKPLSVSKIHNDLKSQGYKISRNDLYEYADNVYSAYLTKFIFNQNYSIQKREVSKKYYAIDNGLMTALSSDLNIKNKLLENIVFMELYRQMEEQNDIQYYHSRKECDFVINHKIPVQVCYDFTEADTIKRELEGLQEAMKHFKSKKGFVLTLEQEMVNHSIPDKFKVIPAYEFILNMNKYL